jgi:hypothetical protein
MRRQSAVPHSHQRALLRRLQLPSHFCHHVSRPACHPRGLQHARPIYRYILPRNLERFTPSVHSHRSPFSPASQNCRKIPCTCRFPPVPTTAALAPNRRAHRIRARLAPQSALRSQSHPRPVSPSMLPFLLLLSIPFFSSGETLFCMLSFYKCLQAIQVCLPETPVAAQPRIHRLQRHGIQLVDAMSSLAPLLHQLRASQHSQMFRYRRPRHGKGSRNLPRWQAPLP